MCIATAGLIAAGVGAAASAGGAIYGGIAARNQANYQAEVAKNNQQIAAQNERYARAAGSVATERAGLAARAKQGALGAALAGSGIDADSGSASEVRQSEAEIGRLSEETTAQNADLTAYGYKTQATNFAASATLDRSAAANAIPGSVLSAGGSLLSSASLLPLKYRWMSGSGSSGDWSAAS